MGEASFKIMLIIFNVIFIAFIGAIILFIRQYRIKKRTHLKELETIDVLHKKELLKTQMEIQSQTMKYIGREIHDNIGQKLTLSSLYLQQLVFENKTEQITDNINNINDIINESLTELRHLSKSLTDDTVEDSSISELIDEECKKIRVLQKHDIIFSSTLDIELNSYQKKSILLRVTQEFLQNSIKHSKCTQIHISIFNTKSTLTLLLKDNGKGFDVKNIQTNGIGLKNMKKRIKMIKGDFKLKSNTINGTKLTVEIPI
jgi:signal transduction histidine kinase